MTEKCFSIIALNIIVIFNKVCVCERENGRNCTYMVVTVSTGSLLRVKIIFAKAVDKLYLCSEFTLK